MTAYISSNFLRILRPLKISLWHFCELILFYDEISFKGGAIRDIFAGNSALRPFAQRQHAGVLGKRAQMSEIPRTPKISIRCRSHSVVWSEICRNNKFVPFVSLGDQEAKSCFSKEFPKSTSTRSARNANPSGFCGTSFAVVLFFWLLLLPRGFNRRFSFAHIVSPTMQINSPKWD